MSNKSSTSSSNNHFHYHLYQYQTHNCCFNLDPSKTSSTVTTAASNENFSTFHTQSVENSCQTAEQSRNTQDNEEDKSKTSLKFSENPSQLTSSGSEFPSTIFNTQSRVNFNLSNSVATPSTNVQTPASETQTVCEKTPLYDERSSKSQSSEKVIEIQFSNDNYRQPEEKDDCSCTKKYLPYKVNEKNVWQVYETSDCKYIQSKYEIDEIFQAPTSSDGTKTSSNYNPLLHSHSNFSNQIICHTTTNRGSSEHSDKRSVETYAKNDFDKFLYSPNNDKHESANSSTTTPFKLNSTGDSLYTPSFNIKPESVEGCQCIDEETEDTASKVNDDDDDASVTNKPLFSNDPYKLNRNIGQESFSGKLLNRPKATNNISRDQVKPVEKEIQNEITTNGGKLSMRNSKPIRLPSPVPKHHSSPKRNKSFEHNTESSEDCEFSSIESARGPVKENKKSAKTISNQKSPKDKANLKQQNTLARQDNKSIVIPNIHQGKFATF